MLEGLGHAVEPAWPAALADESLPDKFMTLWATQMAMAARAVERDDRSGGHRPMTWSRSTGSRSSTHGSSAPLTWPLAQAAMYAFRRNVQQWWADGWDLLLTPTLAEPPPPLEEFASNPDDPVGADAQGRAVRPFTPAFNMSGQPAISLPLHWSDDGLPIGVQLVAAYGTRGPPAPGRRPNSSPPTPGPTAIPHAEAHGAR